MSTKVLLTGASGFLGRAVLNQLLADPNISVVATSRRHPGIDGRYLFIPCDLASDDLHDLLEGVDAIIHCAGLAHQFSSGAQKDQSAFDSANRLATEKLIKASCSAGARDFVYISSVSVYGSGAELTDEKRSTEPTTPYAQSKLAAEQVVQAVAIASDIRCTVLRMVTLYGAGDPGNVGRLLRLISRGYFVQVGKGENRKSLIHCDDAASACLAALGRKEGNKFEVYNVGGTIASMEDIVSCLEQSLNTRRLPISVPTAVARGLSSLCSMISPLQKVSETINKWLRDDIYDASKFSLHTGFKPQVALSKGLTDQVESHLRHERETRQHETPVVLRMPRRRFGVRSSFEIVKRLLDIAAAIVIVSMLIVPALGIAAVIRLTSRGPVLYWSQRVGRNNELFWMPKFRSMYLETPEVATHLLADSKRWITPIGRFLRKTSLDELPQLWCILTGDMSFVGPRPALHNQDDLIRLRTAAGVHKLVPGLTGLAQINGRDELSIPEKVSLDAEYLADRSLALDLKIGLLTFYSVLLAKGVKQADTPARKAA